MDAGLNLKFYTFYGNGLGAPAAIGDAGVGRVRAVAEWHPNVGGREDAAYRGPHTGIYAWPCHGQGDWGVGR